MIICKKLKQERAKKYRSICCLYMVFVQFNELVSYQKISYMIHTQYKNGLSFAHLYVNYLFSMEAW